MFICNECGQQYKNKPQYCDCGNDTFNEVVDVKNKISIFEKYGINNFSLIFFIVCLILSVVVLMFFPKVSEVEKKHEPTVLKQVTNIPPLESFWKDDIPVQTEPQPQIVEQIVQYIIPKPVTKSLAKPVVKQEKKVVTAPTKVQNKVPPTSSTVNKPKPVQKNNVTNNVVRDSSKIEVTNYKIALRKKLFSNLSVSSIQGDGRCGVEFSVDENGKLINRGFSFYSDNKSVNDEVYKMMMRTPSFNPPPAGYKGEKIKLIFEFENNSFSVSFGN